MAYIFRCDVCGAEETLESPAPSMDNARNCEGCGEDGCKECLPKGRCETCLEDAEPNDR